MNESLNFSETSPIALKRFRKQELRSIYNVFEHFQGDLRKTAHFLGYLTVTECRKEIENYTRGRNIITIPINTELEID